MTQSATDSIAAIDAWAARNSPAILRRIAEAKRSGADRLCLSVAALRTLDAGGLAGTPYLYELDIVPFAEALSRALPQHADGLRGEAVRGPVNMATPYAPCWVVAVTSRIVIPLNGR